MTKEAAASLNPEDFVEGGGLIDDVDVTFKECVFGGPRCPIIED
jgi:hypothetical protein